MPREGSRRGQMGPGKPVSVTDPVQTENLRLPGSAAGGSKAMLAIVAGALGACILSLLRFTPETWFWNYTPRGRVTAATVRVPLLLAQLHDPIRWDRFAWADGPVGPLVANGNALRWRLLMPVIGHTLHLSLCAYLALPWLGLVALLAALGYYTYRESRDVTTTVTVLSLASTSSAFFVATDWLGQFDPFYLLGRVAKPRVTGFGGQTSKQRDEHV